RGPLKNSSSLLTACPSSLTESLRIYVPASALVRPCCDPLPARAGVHGHADTLQVHPCKLAVYIPETRRSAQPCPQPPNNSAAAGSNTISHSEFPPLGWDAPDATV